MPTQPPLTKTQLRVVWLSLIGGGVARLLYVVVLHPATRHVYSDMAGYVYRAMHFFNTPQTIADSIYPPGASIFFGILYRLDPAWNLSELVQWALSLGSMALIGSLARRLYGNAAAVVALALAAVYFPFLHYAGLFLAENPFMFLMLATLRLFVHAIDARGRAGATAWAAAAGLAAGVAASFKTTILGPLAVTGALYVAYSLKHRRPHWLAISAAIVVGVALLFVPMSLRCTQLTEGRLCLAATNGPINMLQGHYGEKFLFHWRDRVRGFYFDFGSPTAALRGYTGEVWLDFGAYDSEKNLALLRDHVAAHPGAALLQSFGNVLDLFNGRTIWPDPHLWGVDFGALYQKLFWLFVLLPAAARIAARWRPMMDLEAESLPEWLLLAPLLGLALLAFIGEGEVRYRVPFDGLLMTLAARSYVAAARALHSQWARWRQELPLQAAP